MYTDIACISRNSANERTPTHATFSLSGSDLVSMIRNNTHTRVFSLGDKCKIQIGVRDNTWMHGLCYHRVGYFYILNIDVTVLYSILWRLITRITYFIMYVYVLAFSLPKGKCINQENLQYTGRTVEEPMQWKNHCAAAGHPTCQHHTQDNDLGFCQHCASQRALLDKTWVDGVYERSTEK